MADCCAGVKSELSALRAEIAKFKPVDEEAIIVKAVKRAKGEIVPLIEQLSSALKLIETTLKVVKRTAEAAEAVAKAAEAIAKAVKPLIALVPLIPALIAVAGLVGLILGFAARIASVEKRVQSLESGLNSVFSILNQISNSILRLQQKIANIQLKKGDKGDRGERGLQGSPGAAGYTPVKNKDYFDGKEGKAGYTPVKNKDYFDGKEGRPGYTPVKGRDYFDGKEGKAGYTPVKNKDYFDGKEGRPGYTPVKGRDYFDGKEGKVGYTPVKGRDYFDGKEGRPGHTPVKGRDYFDGKEGKVGYTPVKGRDYFDGKDGQSIKGDRGSDGRSIKGDRGVPGQSIKGDKGDAEMPTDLSPVLSAIAALTSKLNVVSKQVDIVHEAINIEIDGSIGSESCASGIEPFAYSGLGLVGIHNQVIAISNVIGRLHEDVCNIYSGGGGGGGGVTPEESELLKRIYAILGGSVFYPIGNEEEPRFLTNAEVPLRAYSSVLFNEDGSEGGAAVCNNILDAIHISNAVNYYRLGLHEFPASLPESLISKDEGFLGNLIPNENKDIHNLTRYLTWYVERFDEVIGQWEIPIEIKDSDPSKPGDQPVGIKLPNIAEAIAEMFILCFQTNLNSETLLNMTMRVMGDGAADKKQNFISYKLLQSLTDYIGFKQKDINMKMPLLFTLGKTKYQDILKESEEDVSVVEFDDKFGLEADLMRFREAAAMLAAVHKRKIDPNGDIKAQIVKYLLDLLAKTDKVNKNDDDDNFEQFLKDVEVGFTTAPGMKDAVNPYGRPFVERPRIRDLNDYKPPTET